MIEVVGNLWEYKADIRVITTNGTVKKNGECVMGRGCAAEAKQKYPDLPRVLGDKLKAYGNKVFYLGFNVYSFPVKHDWYERADLELIRRSAHELVDVIDPAYPNDEGHIIVLPRPGCGNGNLQWCWHADLNEGETCYGVKHAIENILDDRFHVITFA